MDTESPVAAPEGEVIAPPDDAPQPTTEGGASESQPEEGGEVDITTLPDAVQKYIHELREEAKGNRKAHEPYKNAFSAYNEAEQEYLLNLVSTLGIDQDAGATEMLRLSQRMLGIEQEAEATLEDPEIQKQAADAGMSKDELVATIRAEMQQEQLFAEIDAETRAVGFEPGTPEANKLYSLAVALEEDDLSKVAPIARQALGLPEPEAEKPVLQAADINPEPQAEFPVTPTANTSTADVNSTERTTPPAINSSEMRDRVARRIAASSVPGQ